MESYRNIPGWFNDDSARVLDELIKRHEIKTVLEIGTFLGRSAAFFAERVEKVYCIDPFLMWKEGTENGDALNWTADNGRFLQEGESFYEKTREYLKNYPNVVLIKAGSQEASQFGGVVGDMLKSVDMVYIDGSHDTASVANDIQLWAPRATKIVSGDDYHPGVWDGVVDAVKVAFPEYKKADDHSVVWYFEKNKES